MKVELYKIDGNKDPNPVELPDPIFNVEPNNHVIYMAVRSQMNNMRQGTHSSKSRSFVSGGGKKPWRQKGRGTARAGSTRSPIWRGGGRVFGPQPRDYETKLPKKVKQLARISAFATKMKDGQVRVIEDFRIESGKSRDIFRILKSQGLEATKVLLLLSEYDQKTLQASRNLPILNVQMAEMVSTYDILNCKMLLIQQSAISKLQGNLLS